MPDPFVDHYEALQLSPNASVETIERVYRLLAKRFHPDNLETGNASKFKQMHAAYLVLSDVEKRAAYDVVYESSRGQQWKIFDQETASDDFESDRRIFKAVLGLLYAARRRDVDAPGLGIMQLEKFLGCPEEHLAFHVWYLREKGWIEKLQSGQWAITVHGIDEVAGRERGPVEDRLLLSEGELGSGSEADAPQEGSEDWR